MILKIKYSILFAALILALSSCAQSKFSALEQQQVSMEDPMLFEKSDAFTSDFTSGSDKAYCFPLPVGKAKMGKDCYVGAFAYIAEGVEIGDGCQIYPGVTIMENVKVGSNCLFYPHVSIYHGCHIGNNVILHSGAVIGADGFGFAPNAQTNQYDKIPQIGIVTIEDDVEIGANTCVDRSTMGTTIVRKGVKLDNLVQIAHNTDIGENTVMSSQVGVAGSTKVGQWCMFGGQVGVSGHITIGDHVLLGAQSGAPSSIESNQMLIGTPPMGKMGYFKSQAIFRKLPDMYKQLNTLQKEIEELKKGKE